MRIQWVLIGITFCDILNPLLVIKSSITPQSLTKSFEDYTVFDLNDISDTFIDNVSENPLVIIDLTLDPKAFVILDLISFSFQAPYLTLTRTHDIDFAALRFYALPSVLVEATSLVKMIEFLGWKNFTVFLSCNEENFQILNFIFKSFSPHQIRICTYTPSISYNELDQHVPDRRWI